MKGDLSFTNMWIWNEIPEQVFFFEQNPKIISCVLYLNQAKESRVSLLCEHEMKFHNNNIINVFFFFIKISKNYHVLIKFILDLLDRSRNFNSANPNPGWGFWKVWRVQHVSQSPFLLLVGHLKSWIFSKSIVISLIVRCLSFYSFSSLWTLIEKAYKFHFSTLRPLQLPETMTWSKIIEE